MMRYIYALIAIAVITASYLTVAKAEVVELTLPFNLSCGPEKEVFSDLKSKYGETPSLMAYESTGRRMYWTLDETASNMSLVNVDNEGIACVIWSTTCEAGECLAPATGTQKNKLAL